MNLPASCLSDRRTLLKSGTLAGLAAVTGTFAHGAGETSERSTEVPEERLPKRALGFMLPHEQFDVGQLVEFGVAAENAGFDCGDERSLSALAK